MAASAADADINVSETTINVNVTITFDPTALSIKCPRPMAAAGGSSGDLYYRWPKDEGPNPTAEEKNKGTGP